MRVLAAAPAAPDAPDAPDDVTDEWVLWSAPVGAQVWRLVDDPDAVPAALADVSGMTPDATVEGLRLTLPNGATTGDSHADAVSVFPVEDPETLEGAFEPVTWSFEPGEEVVAVRSLPSAFVAAAGGTSLVAGPEGRGALRLPWADIDVDEDGVPVADPPVAALSSLDGEILADLEALLMTTWHDPASETCDQPGLAIGVDLDGDLESTDDLTSLLYASPCEISYNPFAVRDAQPELPTGHWRTLDVHAGLVAPLMDLSTGIDQLIAMHPNARITDRFPGPDEGGVSVFGGGIVLGHGSGSSSAPLVSVDEGESEVPEPTPQPALVDRISTGLAGDELLDTFDFALPAGGGGGGGGTPGYSISIPAGGGKSTAPLPGGTGSITVTGNSAGGTFTLVPGGAPAGTPGNFRILGQSWDITPPSGFRFTSAIVCLPYDEAALSAAGFDERPTSRSSTTARTGPSRT